jgi:hypothetical protein
LDCGMVKIGLQPRRVFFSFQAFSFFGDRGKPKGPWSTYIIQ